MATRRGATRGRPAADDITKPSPCLGARECAVWKSTLASVPTRHFSAIDRPLLDQYVTGVVRVEDLRELASKAPATATTREGREIEHAAHRMLRNAEAHVAKIASKLRISTQSRRRADASHRDPVASAVRKPWVSDEAFSQQAVAYQRGESPLNAAVAKRLGLPRWHKPT